MSIEVTCNCGKTYHLRDELMGKKARCQACGGIIHVPKFTSTQGTDPLFDELSHEIPAASDPLATGGSLASPRRPRSSTQSDFDFAFLWKLGAVGGVLLLVIIAAFIAVPAIRSALAPKPVDTVYHEPPKTGPAAATGGPPRAYPANTPQDNSPLASMTVATNVRGATLVALDAETMTSVETHVLEGDQLEHEFELEGDREYQFCVRIGDFDEPAKATSTRGCSAVMFESRQLEDLARMATCLIRLPEGGFGSGFLFRDRQTVATAAHVLSTKSVEDVEVVFDPAEEAEEIHTGAKLCYFDADADVAIIRLAAPVSSLRPFLWPVDELPSTKTVIDRAKGTVTTRQPEVIAVGCPSRGGDKYDALFTRRATIIGGRPDEFVLSVELKPGYSGGPICETETGCVAGIVSYKLQASTEYKSAYQNIGLTFAKSVNLVNDSVAYWERMPEEARERKMAELSSEFAHRYGYRCALNAGYHLYNDLVVYGVCGIQIAIKVANDRAPFEAQLKAKYAQYFANAPNNRARQQIQERMEEEDQQWVKQYVATELPGEAKRIREKITPRLRGDAERWYKNAMDDETLSEDIKTDLKIAYDSYMYLKQRAENIDSDGRAAQTTLKQFIDELERHLNFGTAAAVEAGKKAVTEMR